MYRSGVESRYQGNGKIGRRDGGGGEVKLARTVGITNPRWEVTSLKME